MSKSLVDVEVSISSTDDGWFVLVRFSSGEPRSVKVGPWPERSDAELMAGYFTDKAKALGAVDIQAGLPH